MPREAEGVGEASCQEVAAGTHRGTSLWVSEREKPGSGQAPDAGIPSPPPHPQSCAPDPGDCPSLPLGGQSRRASSTCAALAAPGAELSPAARPAALGRQPAASGHPSRARGSHPARVSALGRIPLGWGTASPTPIRATRSGQLHRENSTPSAGKLRFRFGAPDATSEAQHL